MHAKTVISSKASSKAVAAKPARSWFGNFLDKLYALCAEPLIMGLFSGIGYHGSKLVYELVYSRIAPPSPSARSVHCSVRGALAPLFADAARARAARTHTFLHIAPAPTVLSHCALCLAHRIEARADGEPAALRTVGS